MRTTTRVSMLLGAGLLSAVVGVGPAQASPAPPPHSQDVIGYFSSRFDCEWVARAGEIQHRWNDADCDLIRFGPYRGMWVLKADRMGIGQGWPGHIPILPIGPGMLKPGGSH